MYNCVVNVTQTSSFSFSSPKFGPGDSGSLIYLRTATSYHIIGILRGSRHAPEEHIYEAIPLHLALNEIQRNYRHLVNNLELFEYSKHHANIVATAATTTTSSAASTAASTSTASENHHSQQTSHAGARPKTRIDFSLGESDTGTDAQIKKRGPKPPNRMFQQEEKGIGSACNSITK